MKDPLLRVVTAGDTHIGRRDHNEDAILLRRELGLFVLADGAGGASAGNVASSLATSTIAHEIEQMPTTRGFGTLGLPLGARRLSAAVQSANAQIVHLARSSDRFQGMGTTVVAALVEHDVGIMHLAHVGDSRCYRLRGGHVELLTQDHSLANDVLELAPEIGEERSRSLPSRVITRALGMSARVRVSMQTLAIVPGDRYLLCSDGLTDELDEEQIADALRQSVRPPALVKLLLDIADAANARDNTAVIVFDIHAIADVDWPTPPLRARPTKNTEVSDPEILIIEDHDWEQSVVVEGKPLDDDDEPPTMEIPIPAEVEIKVLPEGSGNKKGLEAVQMLMREIPSGTRPGAERDPTMRFRRKCPSCSSLYDGKKNACPNCWKD
ncbi:MAG: serine/threonine protein phosphatase PrpC [Polyangiales bacterium]|jgi:serine/threonine protein phosphatase PrpC